MAFDFSPYQAVLLDLDGTLYKEDQPLPGAVALVQRLLASKQVVASLSNSTQSPQRIARRLAAMGIPMAAEAIFTAASAAVDYCVKRYAPHARLFNLATEGVQEMLGEKGTWIQTEADPCDAVLIGNPACAYATVARAQTALRLLLRGAACVGICADRTYPSPTGLEIGSGAMTHMLAFAASAQPIFFGKPQKIFFQQLCQRLNVQPARCILLGDSLESDIAGAKAVGMATILVLGGVSQESDLPGLPKDQMPDQVVESLLEL